MPLFDTPAMRRWLARQGKDPDEEPEESAAERRVRISRERTRRWRRENRERHNAYQLEYWRKHYRQRDKYRKR